MKSHEKEVARLRTHLVREIIDATNGVAYVSDEDTEDLWNDLDLKFGDAIDEVREDEEDCLIDHLHIFVYVKDGDIVFEPKDQDDEEDPETHSCRLVWDEEVKAWTIERSREK